MTFRRATFKSRFCTLSLLLVLTSRAGLASEPLTYYGFDKESYSEKAQQGLEEIFAGHLFHASSAVPVAAARLLLGAMAGSKTSVDYDPASPEGMFYAMGRLPSPPSRTSGAAPGFGLGESVLGNKGVQVVTINCMSCHAGVVNGQVVAGLINNHFNQSNPKKIRTRGDNLGPYMVWKLIARLADPANEGLALAKDKTEFESLIDSVELPPVDGMPWWLKKYKTHDYWYADIGDNPAASFAINFTVPHAEMNAAHAEHVRLVDKALAFAMETQSPPFPASLDADLVQQGADLFHGRTRPTDPTGFTTCKTCHGSYRKKPSQPDLSRPGSWEVDYHFSHVLRNVKTDASYNTVLRKFKPILEHGNKLEDYYETQGAPSELVPYASIPDRDGYVAPPLVGVWASAPYFHNGSAPTLDTVLNSGQRPEIWARDNRDAHAYDLERVGMAYRSISRAEFETNVAAAAGKSFLSKEAIALSTLYDTQGYGHGNTGHTFGDHLTVAERQAIIEFLKSLSGPDMPPATSGGDELQAGLGAR